MLVVAFENEVRRKQALALGIRCQTGLSAHTSLIDIFGLNFVDSLLEQPTLFSLQDIISDALLTFELLWAQLLLLLVLLFLSFLRHLGHEVARASPSTTTTLLRLFLDLLLCCRHKLRKPRTDALCHFIH